MSFHGEMLTYGILVSDHVLHHIDDKMVKNGVNCNCECPKCGSPLIARNKGEHNVHHFAHFDGNKCPGAQMTALHMLAQNLIAEKKQVMLPTYCGTAIQKEARLATFDNVKLEQTCKNENSTRRPDCTGWKNGRTETLWIEIYCKNKISSERKKDIIQRQQYCIEIDCSDLLKKDYTKHDIEKRLFEETSHREWICCPKYDEEDKKHEQEEKDKLIRENIAKLMREQSTTKRRQNAEETKKRLASLSDSIIPESTLTHWLNIWKHHERDKDRMYIFRHKRPLTKYQDITGLWLTARSYSSYNRHGNDSLTNGEIYELIKFAIIGAIVILEHRNQQELLENLLTNKEILEYYLGQASFSVRYPLFLDVDDLNKMKVKYIDKCKDTTYISQAKEVWEIVKEQKPT